MDSPAATFIWTSGRPPRLLRCTYLFHEALASGSAVSLPAMFQGADLSTALSLSRHFRPSESMLPPMGGPVQPTVSIGSGAPRAEERRVGKECRSRWSPYH